MKAVKSIPIATRRTSGVKRGVTPPPRQPIAKLRAPHGEALFPGCAYEKEELEFLVALDRYKRDHHRPHPTWSEVLHIVKALGYVKS